MTEERERRCVTGADPDKRFPVPIDGQFDGMEFKDAPELAAVAAKLIDELPDFAELAANPPLINYVWRQKAKKKQGKTLLGFCGKIAGLTRYYGRCDWTIEVAADACRDMRVTHFQIEALLFHELNHIEVVTDEESGEVSYKVRGEDAYAFIGEIKRYGAWQSELSAVHWSCSGSARTCSAGYRFNFCAAPSRTKRHRKRPECAPVSRYSSADEHSSGSKRRAFSVSNSCIRRNRAFKHYGKESRSPLLNRLRI
jgi:hypothetical protein